MSNPCNLAISPSQDTSRTRKIELPAFSSCVSLTTSRGSWRHDLRPKTILDWHGREMKLKTSIIWLFRAGFVVGYQIRILFSELEFMFGPPKISISPPEHWSTQSLLQTKCSDQQQLSWDEITATDQAFVPQGLLQQMICLCCVVSLENLPQLIIISQLWGALLGILTAWSSKLSQVA